MPKNPAKNVDRYKIAGRQLNEYEFEENQAAIAEEAEAFHQKQTRKSARELPPAASKKAGKKSKKKASRQ